MGRGLATVEAKTGARLEDYAIEVRRDEDSNVVVTVPRLPGLMALGDSVVEAMDELSIAFDEWVEDVTAHGESIPRAESDEEYSGRTLLRMPKSLHGRLAREAQRQQVSLNSWILTILAEGVGTTTAAESIVEAVGKRLAPSMESFVMLTDVYAPEANAWQLSGGASGGARPSRAFRRVATGKAESMWDGLEPIPVANWAPEGYGRAVRCATGWISSGAAAEEKVAENG